MLERRLASKYEPFEVDLGSHISAVAESLSFDSQGPKLRTVEQTRIAKAATALSTGHNQPHHHNRQPNDKGGETKDRGVEDLDVDSVVTPGGPARLAPPGTEVTMVRALCITVTTATVEKLPLGTSLTLPQGEGWVYDDRGNISMRVQDNPSPQLGLDDEAALGGGSVTLASGDDAKIQSAVHVELICPYIAFAPVTQENVDNHSDDDDDDDEDEMETGRVTHRSTRSSPSKKSNKSDDDHDGDFASNPSHSKKSGGGVAGGILDHMEKFLSKDNMKELRKKTGLTTKELADMGFKLGECITERLTYRPTTTTTTTMINV